MDGGALAPQRQCLSGLDRLQESQKAFEEALRIAQGRARKPMSCGRR